MLSTTIPAQSGTSVLPLPIKDSNTIVNISPMLIPTLLPLLLITDEPANIDISKPIDNFAYMKRQQKPEQSKKIFHRSASGRRIQQPRSNNKH